MPTPDSLPSNSAAVTRLVHSACASSAESSVSPRIRSDAVSCGSLVLHFVAATHAVVDSRSAASPAPTPPAGCATVHPSVGSHSGNSIPHRYCRHARRSLKAHSARICPIAAFSYELQPFFSIHRLQRFFVQTQIGTSFRSRVFSPRNCLPSWAWLTSIPRTWPSSRRWCGSTHPPLAPRLPLSSLSPLASVPRSSALPGIR
jgi:hypothetical protein